MPSLGDESPLVTPAGLERPAPDQSQEPDLVRTDGVTVSREIQSFLVGGLERTYGTGDAWLAPYGTAVGRSLAGATPQDAFPPARTEQGATERPTLVGAFGAGHPETDAALRGALADPLPREDRAAVNAEALTAAVERDPEALLDVPPEIPRLQLEAWRDLAQMPLPPAVTDRMAAMNGEIREQAQADFQQRLRSNREYVPAPNPALWAPLDVRNASGGIINLDYFTVRVRLPEGVDPGALLNGVRKNLNSFVDLELSSFRPYPDGAGNRDNVARWNSNQPTGSFVTIDIPYNDGTVATIDAGRDHWTFATVQSPQDGLHPVSGNRQFGYTDNGDGTYTLYTRGVDRITDPGTRAINAATGAAFSGADALWESLQNGVATYVRQHGGQAQVERPVIVRPDWSDLHDVLTGREPVDAYLRRTNR